MKNVERFDGKSPVEIHKNVTSSNGDKKSKDLGFTDFDFAASIKKTFFKIEDGEISEMTWHIDIMRFFIMFFLISVMVNETFNRALSLKDVIARNK